MMRFSTMVNGHEVFADYYGAGRMKLWCEELGGYSKATDDPEKLEAALKTFDLSLRKGFSNATAYRNAGNKPAEVEVTSISEDGFEAWIKVDGARQKVGLDTLYATKSEVRDAIDFQADCKEKIAEKWKSVTKWAPQWPEKAE